MQICTVRPHTYACTPNKHHGWRRTYTSKKINTAVHKHTAGVNAQVCGINGVHVWQTPQNCTANCALCSAVVLGGMPAEFKARCSFEVLVVVAVLDPAAFWCLRAIHGVDANTANQRQRFECPEADPLIGCVLGPVATCNGCHSKANTGTAMTTRAQHSTHRNTEEESWVRLPSVACREYCWSTAHPWSPWIDVSTPASLAGHPTGLAYRQLVHASFLMTIERIYISS